jgi:hypothetical protein
MPVFECNCGLIISTTAETSRCLRCQRMLEAANRLRRANADALAGQVAACRLASNSGRCSIGTTIQNGTLTWAVELASGRLLTHLISTEIASTVHRP